MTAIRSRKAARQLPKQFHQLSIAMSNWQPRCHSFLTSCFSHGSATLRCLISRNISVDQALAVPSDRWPFSCFVHHEDGTAKKIEHRGKTQMRKSIATLTALGIGAGSFYLLNRNRRALNTGDDIDQSGLLESTTSDSPTIDDEGTDQSQAVNILKRIRDAAFESSDEKLALALGRPTEEIEILTTGSGVIDGDVVMKARQLAVQRGVEL